MKNNRNHEEISKRCEILESFGFEIAHIDIRVLHPAFDDIEFDFSATNVLDPKDLLTSALKQMDKQSFKQGRSDTANKMTSMLKYISDLSTLDDQGTVE